MKKFCTRCGRQFEAVGREVICPACKAQAAEETKRAAVERAKRASWTGESVPVRISGRASTVIRAYSASHTMTFAEALDALLRTTNYFLGLDKAWVEVTPYKSHRRDKHSDKHTTDAPQASKPQASKPQDKAQDAQDAQDVPQEVQAAKATSKTSTSKTSKTSKASKSTSKASKASK